MLRVSSPPALTRDGADIEIVYDPAHSGEASLTLVPGDHVAIGALSAYVDGSAIALKIQREQDRVHVDLGWLDVAVTLTARVSAAVPVSLAMSGLRVMAESESEEITFPLESAPAFLPVRSRLRLSSASAVPGETLTLHVDTTNDGTATAESPCIYIRIPALVTLHAGDDAWIEVEADGTRALVIPVESVDVGERLHRNVVVQMAALGVDRSLLRFEAWLIVGTLRFEFQPAEIEIQSTARAQAQISLVEPRTYRYGERVLAVVGVASRGTDLVRGARVRLAAEGIIWAGLEGGIVEFGALPPFSQTMRLVEGEVVATPSATQRVMLHAFVQAESGELTDAETELTISGTARIEASLVVEEADATRAHSVRLRLTNRGDGTAHSLAVMAELPSGVVGVVDSLSVDGLARYALDGSVSLLFGEELGPLAVGSQREVIWRIRSDVARENGAVTVTFEVDGREKQIVAFTDFVAGDRCSAELPQAVRASVPWSLDVAPPIASSGAVETPEIELECALEASHDEEPATQPETPQAAPRLRVRYDITEEAVNAWRAWFPAGHGKVELGRYVLAARSFAPVGSSIPAADAALSGVRAEAGTVAAARLKAFQQTGVFGASGYDFSTSLLRKSIRSYYACMDEEAGDLEGVGLDRALVRTIGALCTPYAQVVEEFRDALLAALETTRGTVAYAQDAPQRVIHAAEHVLAAIMPLEVA